MKYTRAFITWFMVAAAGVAAAQIVPSLPVQLQNNTLADANQVMANFNAIANAVNASAAKNGVNTDITALTALSTPITPAQGGTTFYYGGAGGGTANAQTVGSVTPAGFALAAGVKVAFIAGASNTQATTLNVASTGVKSVFRPVPAGVADLGGGEIVSGMMTTAVYDGTQWQILNSAVAQLPGEAIAYRGTTAPSGFAFEDGSAVSRTTRAALFAVIGTTYGVGDGSTTFNLPDSRGRIDAGRDDMGGSAANRITNAGSSCVATTLGLGCGGQNGTIATGQLPAHTHASPSVSAVDTGHTHTYTVAGAGGTVFASGNASGLANVSTVVGVANIVVTVAPNTGSTGSGTAFPVLNPTLITNKLIRF